ncbi:glycosyltransferase family 2 protein [Thermoleptolyngbya oregonensis NK1-22]|uniref:Glycosyltransferase family 2 protein n=1 Tax=Thermoleptolyngbya oregonensis NK1-22 TaxID=2547457 RepID=A0AA97BC81_9CYAN|nr:glycosyltransferase family 2 protein [Thermoleptolyngbya oregonensis NK1-22]
MPSSVSVCIPTYRRPDLVCEAVRSALEQEYPNLEVWVSDDSPDDLTEQALADWIANRKVRYVHNKPALRQARNVNQLFHLATGDLLILLHDDDLLVPGAIAKLAACFEADPSISAAFGKQYWMDHQGRVDLSASLALNAKYRRVAARAGRQSCPMESALVAQFPNDGFMVKTAIARQVGYRDRAEVGSACDLDFGLRLAAVSEAFYFLDEYTASYRATDESITATQNYTHLTFDLLRRVSLPRELEPVRLVQLQKYATPAVNCWLSLGDRLSALQVYCSAGYGWRNRLSLKGLAQGALLLCPPALSRRLVAPLRGLRDLLSGSLPSPSLARKC